MSNRFVASIISVITFLVITFISINVVSYLTNSFQISETDAIVYDKMSQFQIENKHSFYRYLIFTDKGTFISKENILIGKYESSETFFKLQKGHKYHLKLSGWGKSMVTDYKNIIDVQEIK